MPTATSTGSNRSARCCRSRQRHVEGLCGGGAALRGIIADMRSAFWIWAVTGALFAAGILAVFSFGVMLLPLAILAGIMAARLRFWPDVLGAGLGVGCAVLWPSTVNWGVPRCESIVSLSSGMLNGPASVTQRCTTMNVHLWSLAGLAFVLASTTAYGITIRGSRRSTR